MRQTVKILIAWISFTVLPNCKLSNTLDQRILDCGPEIRTYQGPILQLKNPDGTLITDSSMLSAYPLQSENKTTEDIQISSKGCLMGHSLSDEPIAIRSTIEGRSLGLIVNNTQNGSLNLRDVSKDSLRFSCDKTIVTKDYFRVPSTTSGSTSSFSVEAAIEGEGRIRQIWKPFRPDTETFPSIAIPKDFPDGDYRLNIKVENLLVHKAEPEILTCHVLVDRTPPKISLKVNGHLINQADSEFQPGQTLQFVIDDFTESFVYYCLQEENNSECTNQDSFTRATSLETTFIPSSGNWVLHLWANDAAGNSKTLPSLKFSVVDKSKVSSILSKLREAVSLRFSESIQSISTAFAAFDEFEKITFPNEKEMVSDDLLLALNQLNNDVKIRAKFKPGPWYTTYSNEKGAFAVFLGSTRKTLSIIGTDGKSVASYKLENELNDFRVSPRGNWLIEEGNDSVCKFYKLGEKKLELTWTLGPDQGLTNCDLEWTRKENIFHSFFSISEIFLIKEMKPFKINLKKPNEINSIKIAVSHDERRVAAVTEDRTLYVFERKLDELEQVGNWSVPNYDDISFGTNEDANNIFILTKEGEIFRQVKNLGPELINLLEPFSKYAATKKFSIGPRSESQKSRIKSANNGDLWILNPNGFTQIQKVGEDFMACTHASSTTMRFDPLTVQFWTFINQDRGILVKGWNDSPSYVLDVSVGCISSTTNAVGFVLVENSQQLSELTGSELDDILMFSEEGWLNIWQQSPRSWLGFNSFDALASWTYLDRQLLVGLRSAHLVQVFDKSGKIEWQVKGHGEKLPLIAGFKILEKLGLLAIAREDGSLELYDTSGVKAMESPATLASKSTGLDDKLLVWDWDPKSEEIFMVTEKEWINFKLNGSTVNEVDRSYHGLPNLWGYIRIEQFRGRPIVKIFDDKSMVGIFDSRGKTIEENLKRILQTSGSQGSQKKHKHIATIDKSNNLISVRNEDSFQPYTLTNPQQSEWFKFSEDGRLLVGGLYNGDFHLWRKSDTESFQAIPKDMSWKVRINGHFPSDAFHLSTDGRFLLVSEYSRTHIFKDGRKFKYPLDHKLKNVKNNDVSWFRGKEEFLTLFNSHIVHFSTSIEGNRKSLCDFIEPSLNLKSAGIELDENFDIDLCN